MGYNDGFANKLADRICVRCHIPINIGEMVSWNRRAPKGTQATWHIDCSKAENKADRGNSNAYNCDSNAYNGDSNAVVMKWCKHCGNRYAFANIGDELYCSNYCKSEAATVADTAKRELQRIEQLKERMTAIETNHTNTETIKGDEKTMMQETSNYVPTKHNGSDLATILAKAIEDKLTIPSASIDSNQVSSIVQQSLEPIKDNIELMELMVNALSEKVDNLALVEPKKQEIVVCLPDEKKIEIGKTHKQFEQVLKIVASGEEVYLWGEAGSGKTTLCKQMAKALDIPFYYDSLDFMSPASVVKGLINANGEYVPSKLYQAYKYGGLYLLDEMDNANSNLLSSLNTCLGNGLGSFGNEMVERHEKFRFVGAGNTNGYGKTNRYPSRQKFDGAFKNRFTCVKFEYDTELEYSVAGNKTWVDYVLKVRDFTISQEIEVLVTPRASIKGAKLLSLGFNYSDVAEWVIFCGVTDSIKQRILSNCPLPTIE